MENSVLNKILLVVSILGILFFTLYGLYSFTDFWRDLIPKTTDSSFFQKAAPSNSTSLKTYQNEFLSFSLKYPSSLTYIEESPKESQLYEWVSFYDKEGESEKPVFTLQINQTSPQDHKILNYASRAVPGQPVTFEEASDTGGKGVFSVSPLNLNGQDWVKVVVQKDNQNSLLYLTAVKNSQAVYTVSLYGEESYLTDLLKTFEFKKT